jgi:hypothetical protein
MQGRKTIGSRGFRGMRENAQQPKDLMFIYMCFGFIAPADDVRTTQLSFGIHYISFVISEKVRIAGRVASPRNDT